MKVRSIFKVLGSIAILAISPPLVSQTKDKPTETEHRTGPHGLEGWTLEYPLPDSNYGDQRFAFTLVLARSGHRFRRIEGEPIIWKWMFWADGRQVAYETGPLHFGMSCILADVKTGRKLEILDCYHQLPANVPAWVTALNP
jgi:hypothetical protein